MNDMISLPSKLSKLFALKLFLTTMMIGNMIILTMNANEFEEFRDFLGQSRAEFSALMGGTIVLLTAFMIGTSIVVRKNDASFDPLIPSVAAIFFNYSALANIVRSFDDSRGSILVAVVCAVAIACLVIKLFLDNNVMDKFYFFIAAQCMMLVLFLIFSLCMVIGTSWIRKISGIDNSDYFLNPVMIAPILLLPHFVISFIDPGRASVRTRMISNLTIYLIFFLAMVVFVPPTIHGGWSKNYEDTPIFKYMITGLYCFLFFIIFELFRPESFYVSMRPLLMIVLKHVVFLTLASSFLGIILLYAAMEEGKNPLYFVFLGHAIVGLITGIALPFWYFLYQKYLLPKLQERVVLSSG